MASNSWYHPNLSNSEAESLLKDKGFDGSYLVRPSQSAPGQFSLSVRRGDKVTHFKIRRGDDSYILKSGDHFKTLTQLVKYYVSQKLQLTDKDGAVFELKWPLNSLNSPTERWFHGSISGAEAEELIRKYGVNGSFLVRESQSHLGGYVLTVRTKDELSQADKVTHIMIRYHHNKYDVGGGKEFSTLTELVEYYKRNPMVETTGTVVNMRCPFNTTRLCAYDIDARVSELSKEEPDGDGKEGFWEEFEQLQIQGCKYLFDRKIGQSDGNVSKNRYKNILSYDHTRVKLKKPDSDYINANYIKLVDDLQTLNSLPHSKIYIATQGPLPNTVDDFWWMVWQENSDTIVMVTKEVENCKNKCHRYWPTSDEKLLSCGSLEVKFLKENSATEDYTIREFEIRRNSIGRRVVQYQFHAWPDGSIPANPSYIIEFLNVINKKPPKGPLIVHCSAGIGRSGTLIVCDMLIDQLKHNGLVHEIDIYQIVLMARAQRSGLVQFQAQYKFIHLAIQEYVNSNKPPTRNA